MRKTGLLLFAMFLLFLTGCQALGGPVEFRILISSELNGRMGPCG